MFERTCGQWAVSSLAHCTLHCTVHCSDAGERYCTLHCTVQLEMLGRDTVGRCSRELITPLCSTLNPVQVRGKMRDHILTLLSHGKPGRLGAATPWLAAPPRSQVQTYEPKLTQEARSAILPPLGLYLAAGLTTLNYIGLV